MKEQNKKTAKLETLPGSSLTEEQFNRVQQNLVDLAANPSVSLEDFNLYLDKYLRMLEAI